ncbi:MAG: hypothetical protein J6K46_09105 [Sutterella sp.]|nr:hypothetical protein [Sutterella sp.]MDY4162744.1 hypothetical protein [Sutterella sp.]
MADPVIATAIQRGPLVCVYDMKRYQLFCVTGELMGYTANTVTVKKNSVIVVYNSRRMTISTHTAR